MTVTFDPKRAEAGQTNVLVTISRKQFDLVEPVGVRFLTRKDNGEFVDCGDLGDNPDALQDNEYISIVSDPITSGGNKIEVTINIAAVNTPQSFSKVYVRNGDDQGFLSDECFEVEPV
jgi:hypothetical protein